MDYREDYFRSPTTKNLEPFYTGVHRFQGDEVGIPNQNLFSPFSRDYRSPFSAFSPVVEVTEQKESDPIDGSPVAGPKKIKGKINFEDSEMSEEQFKTPERTAPKLHDEETTSRKKYHLRLQVPSSRPNLGKDSERGLRALSKQSYEILKYSQALTYQEVAGKIIEENDEIGEYSDKEKQSIKRRVYDALNVLIAVGVMEKRGKKISMVQEIPKKSMNKKFIISQLQKMKQSVFKKKQLRQNLIHNTEQLEALVERNKKVQQKYLREREKILFPLILVGSEDTSLNTKKTNVILNSSGKQKDLGSFRGTQFAAIRLINFDKVHEH